MKWKTDQIRREAHLPSVYMCLHVEGVVVIELLSISFTQLWPNKPYDLISERNQVRCRSAVVAKTYWPSE